MRFSCEMLSVGPDDTIKPYPNKLRMFVDDARPGGRQLVYLEVSGLHDGVQVNTTVCIERAVLAYHIKASGVLS